MDGRVVVVTGGCGGIGQAYARRFTTAGAHVVLADIEGDLGAKTAARLADETGGDVRFVACDVSDEGSVDAAVGQIVASHGRIDVLVNNAAIFGTWDVEDQSLGYLKRMFDVNLHGVWLMTRAVSPHMVEAGWGRIVNQSSGAAYNYHGALDPTGFNGLPSFNYQQTKLGVIGLTKWCAAHLGRYGITVNCIAPGVVETPAMRAKVPASALPRIEAQQAIPGIVQPDDLAAAALYFASDDARFVTGQVLVVDGGKHMPA